MDGLGPNKISKIIFMIDQYSSFVYHVDTFLCIVILTNYNLQVFALFIWFNTSILHSFLIVLYLCNRIIMAMGFFYYGLKDTSATYATNFLNLVPIVTFIFSTVSR